MLSLSAAAGWAATPVSVAKTGNGAAHFVIGGKVFVPVGVNYLIQHVGAPYQTFDMFDTKTFNIDAINQNMQAIAAEGFNVVRLWLKGFDPDQGFGLAHDQISEAYVDNVLATLQSAQRQGLLVILTGAFNTRLWLPKNYLPATAVPSTDEIGGMNRLLMIPAMAEGLGRFYHDLLEKMAAKDPSVLDTIFYFDIYNELHFDLHAAPLSASSGQYSFDGHSYDLGSASGRQALMDSAATAWMRTVGGKIKAVAPKILVTSSSFYLAAGGRSNFDGGLTSKPGAAPSPYPLRPEAMLQGGADLIDIHTYPSPARPGLSAFHDRAPNIMRAESITSDPVYPVPLIAGEFGLASTKVFTPSETLAELAAVRNTFCQYHFSGYVVWAWNDADPDSLPSNTDLQHIVAPKFVRKFCGQMIR
jgi:hypothetical protein